MFKFSFNTISCLFIERMCVPGYFCLVINKATSQFGYYLFYLLFIIYHLLFIIYYLLFIYLLCREMIELCNDVTPYF
jgi:hypothetical protein